MSGSEVINVKEFGSKGNGIDNDFDAIRDAISQGLSADSPAEVFFPAGHYIILSSININSTAKDLHLRGINISSGGPTLSQSGNII